jgi:hypothetical protein
MISLIKIIPQTQFLYHWYENWVWGMILITLTKW